MEITNNEIKHNLSEEESESTMSLHDYWNFLKAQWKWFLLSAIVCVGLAQLYLATQNNVYQRQAVVLVKSDDNPYSHRSSDALSSISGMMGGNGVYNETFILGTRLLASEVAQVLHLDVVYTCKQRLKTISLYNEKPFEVQFLDAETIPARLDIKVTGKSGAEITRIEFFDEKTQKTVKDKDLRRVKFGERVTTKAGALTIIPNPETLEAFQGKTISVYHLSKENATNSVASRISTSEVNKMADLVQIICVDTNTKRADDILNALLDAYRKSLVEDKNKVAESTAQFIEDRIRLVGAELNQVEGNLANFKQANKLVDMSQNAQAYMSQSTSARQRTIQLQAQQSAVQYMLDYLKKNARENQLIPTLGGITEASIQTQIARYNELQLQRNRLVENSSEGGITVRELDTNLAELRQTLIASMEGYASSVDLQVKQALQEEQALTGSIRNMPQQEKQAIDISRQQEIKETLYTYLLNKREETALQLAVSEAKVRVVETPYGSPHPISPRSRMILLIGLVIGLALPLVCYYVYSLFNMGVRGRKDVEAMTTIPILAEIPRHSSDKNDQGIIINEKSDDMLSEAFRVMRYNLGFLSKDAKVIMFTSTMPSEGKSFVSRNFAYSLAVGDKRVVLVDCDLRRYTQSVVMGRKSAAGVTSYLSGYEDDIDKLIQKAQEGTKVQLLPAGPTPPNPTELLMSDRMVKLINYLREHFDYVVLDSIPTYMMADAAVVSRLSDLTVYVIRDGGIDRRYLTELERMHREGRYPNLCILINGSMEYAGGYSSNYKYGYNYYRREDDNKQGWLSRLLRRKKKSHHQK